MAYEIILRYVLILVDILMLGLGIRAIIIIMDQLFFCFRGCALKHTSLFPKERWSTAHMILSISIIYFVHRMVL